jgi:glycolate dehydrogenase iron-sulfur subunit
MQTRFSIHQLANPDIAVANDILRKCVHCGFCTATCPTYVLLGDELDSPRGRIYLIKDMLEDGDAPSSDVVKHVDRCLSCLSCMTTCPASVNYMHLVDQARDHIEETYQRPLSDRMLRAFLAKLLPNPRLFRLGLIAGFLGKPFASLLEAIPATRRLAALARLAPSRLPSRSANEGPGTFPAAGARKKRVALLSGCAQPVLAPEIHDATIRILQRHGVEVVLAKGEGCCGGLPHHLGKTGDSFAFAKRNIDAWTHEIDNQGLDAILVNASGCGTTLKDYGFMFREDPDYRAKAARVSELAADITEFLDRLGLNDPTIDPGLNVAYHSACSLQHGQQVHSPPRDLLRKAGFRILEIPEGHLCCGSAGTYNMLQPRLSKALRNRKIGHIEGLNPDVIATGNLGCITQLATGTKIPLVHTIELLDWATGGPKPAKLS